MPSSLIAPVVGAVAGQVAGKVLGGAGSAAGGLIQAGAAGEAAEQFEPFVGLGQTAAERSRQLFLGSPEQAQKGIERFRTSPDFLLSQAAMDRASRNAGFQLAAQGRNPFTAGNQIASGAGLQAFLQAASNVGSGTFNQFATRLGEFRREGISAAGGGVAPLQAQGQILGSTVSQGASDIAGLFGGGAPGGATTPGTNLFAQQTPFVNPDIGQSFNAPSFFS